MCNHYVTYVQMLTEEPVFILRMLGGYVDHLSLSSKQWTGWRCHAEYCWSMMHI